MTVLRSGIPDTVPGRSLNLCESGIAAMLAEELIPGEAVAIEVQLSSTSAPLQTRAIVRYQDELRSGLEFVGLSAEQHAAIREWAKQAKAESEIYDTKTTEELKKEEMNKEDTKKEEIKISATAIGKHGSTNLARGQIRGGASSRRPRKRQSGVGWTVILVLTLIASAVFWWRWNRGWQELESGLKGSAALSAEKPQVQVPAEVMEKLLVHRVEPTYPPEARKANLQGIIALDIVVGRDGSVERMRALNGPEVLAQAAMDALRWWKFEPYRVNGQPAVVETTLAVEFKK